MPKVLLIKISSMGDIIHTLPALSDAKAAIPSMTFDWVVSPPFAEIPFWHTSVRRLILCPIREWKKNWRKAWQKGEIRQCIQSLRQENYDLIIDAQSALKTAIISKIARGPSAGFDKASVREWGAQWFYDKRYSVEKKQHAITRIRELFSKALNYPWEKKSPPDFGLEAFSFSDTLSLLPQKYVMAIPNTTWPTKHWPEEYWKALIQKMTDKNFFVVIPWGNSIEKERALKWQKENQKIFVPPLLSLNECASVIKKATAAICVDTGLGHLTAALNVPAIHLYGPTDPQKIGAVGKNQIHLESEGARDLRQLRPDQVWAILQSLL